MMRTGLLGYDWAWASPAIPTRTAAARIWRRCTSALQRTAGEPAGAALVQLLHHRALEHRHVHLDLVADARLDVGQVAVTLGHGGEHVRVEFQLRRRVDRVDAVLFIDRL